MKWQPIDTAPRDGSRLILVVAGFQPTVGYWRKTQWWNDRLNASKLAAEFVFGDADPTYAPTHWMPLPPPPLTEEP